jgi:broad specificity phosphatase PhoE
MTMLNFLLIRTGKTDFDCQGRVGGTIDLPLSELGWQQIAALTEELHQQVVVAIYAGPGKATQQTAELVAVSLRQKVKTNKKLRNLDLGLWQGMLVDEVRAKQPRIYKQWQEHPETVCPPEGECLQEAEERLREVIRKLIKKHKEGTVALVLPEPLATLLCHLLRHDELGDLWHSTEEGHPAWELVTPHDVAIGN